MASYWMGSASNEIKTKQDTALYIYECELNEFNRPPCQLLVKQRHSKENKMMAFSSLFGVVLLISMSTAVEWKHRTGRVPNGDRVPFDIAMDGKTMITVSHKPEGSAENFRETTNLFVFNRNLVAIRDSVDKRCYIQHTDLTYAAMKGMVNSDAPDTDGDEERIDISSLTCKPFTPFSVKLLFGDEIESFCRFHDVYFLDDSNVEVVGKEGIPVGDGAANLRLRRDLEIKVTVSIGPLKISVSVRI